MPDRYNAARLASGEITAAHITALTREFQRAVGLIVDGKLGPHTISRLTQPDFQRLMIAALAEAVSDLGKGEIGANNQGPYVWSLTGRKTSGPWCAAAVYAWILRAAAKLGLVCPVARSHSARVLAESVSIVGRRVGYPVVGAVALWPREGGHHVGLVESVVGREYVTIEGNVGQYPAVVKRVPHVVGEGRPVSFHLMWVA